MMLNSNNKYVVFIVPFFNLSNHVGNYRVLRFINWFYNNGYRVIVFSRGKKTVKQSMEWGKNYIIESKILNLLERLLDIGKRFYPIKTIYILIKTFMKIVLIPDEEKLWNIKISKKKDVIQIVKNSFLIIASSPLESVHIASYRLSKKTNIPFIVDLRDGWLDEPLNLGFISKFAIRRYLEERLEKKIYFATKQIIVTSNNWKKALIRRYDKLQNKVFVLTNAYPNINGKKLSLTNNNSNNIISLFYAGRFAGSSRKRKVSLLFKPFDEIGLNSYPSISIKIYSDLRWIDLQGINEVKNKGHISQYNLEIFDFIPRVDILAQLQEASGLLLLSVSSNAIPAKFFEYIIQKKPVLVITYRDNAVWEICSELPQFFLYDLEGEKEYNQTVTKEFLEACKTGKFDVLVPEKYSEEYLEKIFWERIENVMHTK